MLKINFIKLADSALPPQKMSEHAAGYDLYSCHEEDIILKSGEVMLIPTGLAISLPVGFEAQIRPRSGLAIKHQLGVLNSPGTIDADYRGEIKIILFNFGKQDFVIKPQTRIAQMVIAKHETVDFVLTEELDETDRGEGGFGHTEH
ncbi:MAG: dUTP diphosphatase [Candidatus Cloacimonadales bacterium]|nr:dUTP diphosphatase [Candidatus Cloacimonadales bacterium]